MVPSPAGEDDVLRCVSCGYKANVERGTSELAVIVDETGPEEPERIATPGVRTIAALEEIDGGAVAENQIKTMVMVMDDEVTLALLRGDHQLNLQKLQDYSGAVDIRPAEPAEVVTKLGASPGSLGAVGVKSLKVIADFALDGRTNMMTGANEDDWHLGGVSVHRDIQVDGWADLREVQAGEPCVECGETLEIVRCIEAGHIFKLGRRYADAMGISVLDAEGRSQVPTMGSYGIGIGRAVAAVAENHHDDAGLIWPVSVAPYQILVTVLDIDDEACMDVASQLEVSLREAGIDVLVDDRKARPGVKFADAELIGIPFRVTVGARGLAKGEVEFTPRSTGETTMIDRHALLETVLDALVATI